MKAIKQLAKELKNLHNDKRGIAENVTSMIVAVGVGVIVISVIAIMLGAFQADLTANSIEHNVTGQGLTFLQNATDKFDTAGTIVGVLVLLAVLGAAGFLGFQGISRLRSR